MQYITTQGVTFDRDMGGNVTIVYTVGPFSASVVIAETEWIDVLKAMSALSAEPEQTKVAEDFHRGVKLGPADVAKALEAEIKL